MVASDVNEPQAGETVERIRSAGYRATPVGGDVSDSADVLRMVKSVVDAYGRLDVVVNSAGVSARNALGPDASAEEVWDRVIEVNLKGTYLVSWHAVPEMARVGGGSIINLSSIIGLVGYARGLGSGFNPYAASKGGVLQFTRNLAIDTAKDKIRVNCICPGYVETALTEELRGDPVVLADLEGRHPMSRLGRPEDIAFAALFLASDESSYVTGAPLVVDGGYTAQ